MQYTSRYRSRYEIFYSILNSIRNKPMSPTRIMYGSFLSYNQVIQYLEHLSERGLVKKVEVLSRRNQLVPAYHLEPKGLEFISYHDELCNMLGGDIKTLDKVQGLDTHAHFNPADYSPTPTPVKKNEPGQLPLMVVIPRIDEPRFKPIKRTQRSYQNRDQIRLRIRGLMENDPKITRKMIARIMDMPEGTVCSIMQKIKRTMQYDTETLSQTPMIR